MANSKEMNPLSGDTVETDGVYRSEYGHEVQLKAGEAYPMDPQAGKVEYELVEFTEEIGVPEDDGVFADDEEAVKSRQQKHRLRGGNR